MKYSNVIFIFREFVYVVVAIKSRLLLFFDYYAESSMYCTSKNNSSSLIRVESVMLS